MAWRWQRLLAARGVHDSLGHLTRTYFVGDRNVPWWLVLVSIVATETSTVTFLSIPGKGFATDLTFLQLTFGYVIGRVLIAWLLLVEGLYVRAA